MDYLKYLVIAAAAYLLRSLSVSIIVCRLTTGKDIRSYGSGNAGLTNSFRVLGGPKTLLVLLGDTAKAAAAVYLGSCLAGMPGKLCAGIFVILGHVFPVYFGFRGGKGVLVGATMLIFLDWRIFLVAFVLFVGAVAVTRWISLGSILGAASFPVSMQVLYGDWRLTVVAALMGGAVIWLHRSNISRILHGCENRFTFHVKPQITKEEKEESAE